MATEWSLTRRIHSVARYLDDHDFDAFLACLREDGEYLITAQSPELGKKMTWMRLGRGELAERLAAIEKHEWAIASMEQSRVLSVDTIEVNEESARTSSGFALYHTDEAGVSCLYVVGRYEDDWLKIGKEWHLSRREVVLKTRQLDVLSPLPI